MEYREIVAVTGLGGLYQLLATKSDGAIVRNLADKSTKFISARMHNVTPLESIEIYTTGDNIRLQHVLLKMQENEGKMPPSGVNPGDAKAVKAYFKTILPEFDEERVYVSDMKKMLKWYEILKENDLIRFDAPEAEAAEGEEAPAAAETTEEAPVAEKPAKKAAKAKAAPATEEAAEAQGEDAAEKPAKKARAKKAVAAEGEEKPAKKTAKKKSEE